jgi:hypothetical protein
MKTKQGAMPQTTDNTQKIVEAGKDNPANAAPAHEAAEEDMKNDPDMITNAEKGDELDEGELAQLEGEE